MPICEEKRAFVKRGMKMILRSRFLQRQKGVVLVLVALALVLLMGIAALAIDLSHAEVNKTRLQNLADSLALSAAISLNKGKSSQTAKDYATDNTYPTFRNSSGNQEILSANLTIDYYFSHDLSGDYEGAESPDDPTKRFARVVVSAPNMVRTWFAPVLSLISGGNFNTISVSAAAVAGTSPVAPCDLAPIMMCSDVNVAANVDDGDGKFDGIDRDCNDGDCYGYYLNNIYCLVSSTGNSSNYSCEASSSANNTGLGAGNIGLASFGAFGLPSGANTVKKCLAGDPQCKQFCKLPSGTIPSKTGAVWGPVREGIDSLFNQDHPDLGFMPDKITGLGTTTTGTSTANTYLTLTQIQNVLGKDINGNNIPIDMDGVPAANFGTDPYAAYLGFKTSGDYEAGLPTTTDSAGNTIPYADYDRRVLTVPMIDCTNAKNGTDPNLPVVGYGCFFLTSRAEKSGSEEIILGEFIQNSKCDAVGKATSSTNYDFYKVQLYKDPHGGHS